MPELGKYPIELISTSFMENFVFNKLKEGRIDGKGGLSPKTTSDIMIVIKGSFNYAKLYGAATKCHFERINYRKPPSKIRVLSYQDEKKLLSVLCSDWDRYKMGVFLCLYTGIRIGELCALKWENISFAEAEIKIEHTVQRLQNEEKDTVKKTRLIITEPKSYSSFRNIPLPQFLIDAIKPFEGETNEYVLSGDCKTIVEPRTMQYRFKAYLKKADVEYTNFHALRHTFATRCVEAGFDVKTLSEILGHSSVKITLDKYVHSSMQLKRKNMEKLKPII